MKDLVFDLSLLAIRIVAAVIAVYLLPKVKAWIQAHADNEKLSACMYWARETALAAEQIYGAGTGEQKKRFAAEFLYMIAQAKKIDITESQIEILLEAAVGEMNAAKQSG